MVRRRTDGQRPVWRLSVCVGLRYGEEVEGRKVWDVLPVEPDSGGTLLYKGATALLDGAKERQSWSAFHVSLNDASNLTFRVAQGEKGWFSVMGRSRVPAESWVHVAVATSPEAVKLYLNGVEDACKPLPTELLEVSSQPQPPREEG